jgi:hypothetical protein
VYLSASPGLGDPPRRSCPETFEFAEIRAVLEGFERRRDVPSRGRINAVSDVVFIRRHPGQFDVQALRILKLPRRRDASPDEKRLIDEWLEIRDCIVIPAEREWIKLEREEKERTCRYPTALLRSLKRDLQALGAELRKTSPDPQRVQDLQTALEADSGRFAFWVNDFFRLTCRRLSARSVARLEADIRALPWQTGTETTRTLLLGDVGRLK